MGGAGGGLRGRSLEGGKEAGGCRAVTGTESTGSTAGNSVVCESGAGVQASQGHLLRDVHANGAVMST